MLAVLSKGVVGEHSSPSDWTPRRARHLPRVMICALPQYEDAIIDNDVRYAGAPFLAWEGAHFDEKNAVKQTLRSLSCQVRFNSRSFIWVCVCCCARARARGWV